MLARWQRAAMADSYQISHVTRLRRPAEHRHIMSAGVYGSSIEWSVGQIRSAIERGDSFYTTDGHNRIALVEPYTCQCGYQTIRTHPDAVTDTGVDQMPERR